MAIQTKFFTTDDYSPLSDIIYKPPIELAKKVIERKEEAISNVEKGAAELTKLLAINHMDTPEDTEKAKEIQQLYNNYLHQITQGVVDNPLNAAAYNPIITSLTHDMLKNRQSGAWYGVEQRYAEAEKWKKENEELRKSDPDLYGRLWDAYLNKHTLAFEKAQQEGYDDYRVQFRPGVPRPDLLDEESVRKYQLIKENMYDKLTGRYILSHKYISEQRATMIALKELLSDKNYEGYARQMAELGDPGYLDSNGNVISPFLEEPDPNNSGETIIRVNPASAYADQLEETIRILTHDQKSLRENQFYLAQLRADAAIERRKGGSGKTKEEKQLDGISPVLNKQMSIDKNTEAHNLLMRQIRNPNEVVLTKDDRDLIQMAYQIGSAVGKRYEKSGLHIYNMMPRGADSSWMDTSFTGKTDDGLKYAITVDAEKKWEYVKKSFSNPENIITNALGYELGTPLEICIKEAELSGKPIKVVFNKEKKKYYLQPNTQETSGKTGIPIIDGIINPPSTEASNFISLSRLKLIKETIDNPNKFISAVETYMSLTPADFYNDVENINTCASIDNYVSVESWLSRMGITSETIDNNLYYEAIQNILYENVKNKKDWKGNYTARFSSPQYAKTGSIKSIVNSITQSGRVALEEAIEVHNSSTINEAIMPITDKEDKKNLTSVITNFMTKYKEAGGFVGYVPGTLTPISDKDLNKVLETINDKGVEVSFGAGSSYGSIFLSIVDTNNPDGKNSNIHIVPKHSELTASFLSIAKRTIKGDPLGYNFQNRLFNEFDRQLSSTTSIADNTSTAIMPTPFKENNKPIFNRVLVYPDGVTVVIRCDESGKLLTMDGKSMPKSKTWDILTAYPANDAQFDNDSENVNYRQYYRSKRAYYNSMYPNS